MFNSARLKLTAWYLLLIMIISIIFSLSLYRVLMNEVYRFENAQRYRIERRLQEENVILPDMHGPGYLRRLPINTELIQETQNRIIYSLLFVNAVILIMSGVSGYWLAGETMKPIKDMMDEQNRFISDASHELRTPLTSLKTAMEVALRDKNIQLKDTKVLIMESISEVNKLQSLAESLLQLAQFHVPDKKYIWEKVEISSIAEHAIRKVQPLANTKHITITKQLQKLYLSSNSDSLTDLLVILLDNAIKYSEEKKTISLITHKTNGYVKIDIKDEGIGISSKDLPHIFDRFYRADASRYKNELGGYGLGLSIAKKIVDVHHGDIKVKSLPGKGTTFSIKLPISQKRISSRPSVFS